MDDVDRKVLEESRKFLVDNLEADNVVDALRLPNMKHANRTEIKDMKTDDEKVDRILRFLFRGGKWAFQEFLDACSSGSVGQEFISEHLLEQKSRVAEVEDQMTAPGPCLVRVGSERSIVTGGRRSSTATGGDLSSRSPSDYYSRSSGSVSRFEFNQLRDDVNGLRSQSMANVGVEPPQPVCPPAFWNTSRQPPQSNLMERRFASLSRSEATQVGKESLLQASQLTLTEGRVSGHISSLSDTDEPPTPTPAEDSGAKFFLIGGLSRIKTRSCLVEVFEPDGFAFRSHLALELGKERRFGHSACLLPSDDMEDKVRMLVDGGHRPGLNEEPPTLHQETVVFSRRRGCWTPNSCYLVGDELRSGHRLAAMDGLVFYAGGTTADGLPSTKCSVLTSTDTYKYSSPRGEMKYARAEFCLEAVQSGGGAEKLLAMGGTPGDYSAADTVEIYQAHRDSWSLSDRWRLPRAVLQMATTQEANVVYGSGGVYMATVRRQADRSTRSLVRCAWWLDPRRGKLESLPDMVLPRAGHCMASDGKGHIFALGGDDDGDLSVETLDLRMGREWILSDSFLLQPLYLGALVRIP